MKVKETNIHSRLSALEAKVNEAQHQLDVKGHLSTDHKTRIGEIRERYEILNNKVINEVKDAEAHGRHVTDLEQSIRLWLDGLDLD